MQLKDFISNALIEICSGIAEAKQHVKNGAIAPPYKINADDVRENTDRMEQITFEVCVTVNNTTNSQSNNGFKTGILQVISAEIGKNTKIETNLSSNNVNKIAFSVPYLPQAILPLENTKN